jgi:transposase-like protein
LKTTPNLLLSGGEEGFMPQLQLPIFPVGVTHITPELAFERRDGLVTYFNGQMPLFRHGVEDRPSFRMIVSQFVVNGNARQAEIARAFGIPAVNVKRAVRCFREHGAAGFFRPRGGKRGPTVLTPKVREEVQALLDAGTPSAQAAQQLGLKPDTVRKAVLSGRLREKKALMATAK